MLSQPEAVDSAARVVEELIVKHRDELVSFVRRRTGGAHNAEDVVQRAALRALVAAPQLRNERAGRAWLFQITRHVLAEHLRGRQAIERQLPASGLAASSAEAEAEFTCSCVLSSLKHLRPDYALILRRVVLDDVSVTCVASELGISANAATVRVHRAREALKDRLRSHCGTESLRSCLDCICGERGCCTEGDGQNEAAHTRSV